MAIDAAGQGGGALIGFRLGEDFIENFFRFLFGINTHGVLLNFWQ